MSDAEALNARLDEGLAALRIPATAAQKAGLMDFLALLAKWNRVYNLTSVREPRDMLSVHLLDSLSMLPLVDEHDDGALLDVGSGAGLPAIPLAIMRPRPVWSVDAVAKKISFQLQAKGSLALTNLHPVHGRIEAVDIGAVPRLIVSRAFAEIARMLASVERLAGAGTTVIAMKGVVPQAELAALPATWTLTKIVPLDVPFLGAERCAVVLQRAA